MKCKFSAFILGIFFLAITFNPVTSYGSDKDPSLVDVLKIGIEFYKIVDGNCDDKREEGTLKERCKNNDCVTVACISFRKASLQKVDCEL